MASVERGIQSQLRNIETTYGRTIDDLVAVVESSGLTKHADVVAMLKERYGMAHAAAHRVSLVARSRVAQPAPQQAARRARPLDEPHARLHEILTSLGDDIEQAPRKGYVSFRRRKQFAMLQPGAKWINVGLILPGKASTQRLEPAGTWNALFTHRVRVVRVAEIDRQLRGWMQEALRRRRLSRN
jgi:hypothetical protein